MYTLIDIIQSSFQDLFTGEPSESLIQIYYQNIQLVINQ